MTMSTTSSGPKQFLQSGIPLPNQAHQPGPSITSCASELKSAQHTRNCGQCNQAEFKYTCPACSMRTCSLVCSNQHKVERKCSGKRNRVDYVKLNEFSWGKLMQDYTYLEDIHRMVSNARSSRSLTNISNRNSFPGGSSRRNSARRNLLVRKAALEGVQLILVAEGMARRKINGTSYNKKKNCVQWTLEVVFPSSDQKNDKHDGAKTNSSHRKNLSQMIHHVTSDTKMDEILKRALNNKKIKLPKNRKEMLLNLLDRPSADGDEDDLILVIRNESLTRSEEETTTPTAHAQVYVIELNSKLVDALNGTKVLEWPKIEVWTTHEWTAQVSSGQIKILPKIITTGGLHQFKAPVDSGWSNKRIKTETAASNKPARIPDGKPSSLGGTRSTSPVDENLEDQDADIELPPDFDNPQNLDSIMKSLLQYSSSEDESC